MTRKFVLAFVFTLFLSGCGKAAVQTQAEPVLTCSDRVTQLQAQLAAAGSCSSDSDCVEGPLVCGVTPCSGSTVNKAFDQAAFELQGEGFTRACAEAGMFCACPPSGEPSCLSGKCTRT